MRMSIKNIHIYTTDGEENIINFSDSLNFIYGNVGAGKSTMLNLIMYPLGGSLTHTPAVNTCLEAVQIEAKMGKKLLRFFRMINSTRIQIDDVTENRRFSLHQNQISSFLYELFSLPDLYQSIGNVEDRKVKLSFANFCWFSYLKQSEMDNVFFHLNSDNIYKQNAAVNVLFSFFESEFLVDQSANQQYRTLKRRLRKFEDGDEVFKYLENIYGNFGIGKEDNPIAAATILRQQITSALISEGQYSRDDVSRLMNMQRRLDQLEHRAAFESRRERYNKEFMRLRDELAGTVDRINSDRSKANPNVQQLYDLFLDCLINIGFQGVTKHDIVRMDLKTYMPILSNPYENRDVSFENIGSGGKKTLFKICFALAVHRLQHAKQGSNYLPSFLIIDTPMKNISEREDEEMYNRFYQYLFKLFSTELSDTQLFVVDKEKRDLTEYKFENEVVLMRMTRNDWMHPPLFKNYTGV